MLRHLTIHNFAIIKQVSLDFSNGMTVLSGETGAGKSIIIDALSLILGARGSSDFIRYGQDKFTIEALFQFNEVPHTLQEILGDFGFEMNLKEEDLIISREINQSGKNLIRINGNLANVTLLKNIGNFLGDIHGQNEHQQLLDAKQHIYLLDSFGDKGHRDLLDKYRSSYQEFKEAKQEWLNACQTDSNLQQRLNFLSFQLEELQELHLDVEEESQLSKQSEAIQNFQQSQAYLQATIVNLSDGDSNILSLLDQSIESMQAITNVIDGSEDYIQRLKSVRFEIEDIAHQMSQQMFDEHLEFEDIDSIEQRLANISSIKRKYGMTVEELLTYQEEMAEEIDQIVHRESYLNRLEEHLQKSYHNALRLSDQLSQSRKQLSNELSQEVERELSDLYMENSKFVVNFLESNHDDQLENLFLDLSHIPKLHKHGQDQVEFYVTTNVGDSAKPLVKVASGGELSRFMLALKAIFSKNLSEKVMVFDEIDTGVSGRVGLAIAQKMYGISKSHQVLAITHLPPVAAISDQQFLIEKFVTDNETHTQVREIDMQERYKVIVKMMTGEEINDHSIAVVKNMMTQLHDK